MRLLLVWLIVVISVASTATPAAGVVLAGDVGGERAHVFPEVQPRGPAVSVVRTAGALAPALVDRIAQLDGVRAVVPVDNETVRVTDTSAGVAWSSGSGVAFDLYGVDPRAYVSVVPAATALHELEDGDVVLSRSAARQRSVRPGGWIDLSDGRRLDVVAVLRDDLIDGVGGVVTRSTLQGRTRFALVGHDADSDLPDRLDDVVAQVPRTLVRTLGSAPWSEGWRTVASLTALEDALGPLPYRPGAGRSLIPDAPLDVVDAAVPILGAVRCHRAVIQPLSTALTTVERAGLAGLIDPGDYAGCHSPRLIASGGPISRHAFGIAVDINASTNAFGATPTMDPRIVEVFEAAGFVWGGRWPVPDGMHFEWHPEPETWSS